MAQPSPAQPGHATAPHGPHGDFVLVLSCPDRPGLVHAVSGFLVERGGNILESQQFGDRLTRRFFMRIDFVVPGADRRRHAAAGFASVAEEFGMRSSCGRPRRRPGP